MRRLDGIVLADADVADLVAVLQRAARLNFDADAARWAVALAALSAAGQPDVTADPAPVIVTISEWCAITNTNRRTARRHAATGRLPGATKRGDRWVVATSPEH